MDLGTIISLISQKGGVGKSAIARLLAVEFVRAGWSVKIADLDTMQGTSTKWKLRRDAAKWQPEIPVEKFATVARALREAEKYDLVLLDGPAHAEKGGLSMAKKSKLILMPTCYGLDDLEAQIEAAYELEENGIERSRIWFIFSRTSGSANEEQTAREYLQRSEINVLEPVLPELPSIRQGHSGGKAASEVNFPAIRERAMALAVAVATKLQELADIEPEPAQTSVEAA
jgi:chromosome partitioning protein